MVPAFPLLCALVVAAPTDVFTGEEQQTLAKGDVVFRASSSGGRIELFSAVIIPASPDVLHRHLSDACARAERGQTTTSYFRVEDVEPILASPDVEAAVRKLKTQPCGALPALAHFYTFEDVDMPFPLRDTWMLVRHDRVPPAGTAAGRHQSQQVRGGMKTMEMTSDVIPREGGTLYIQRSVYDLGIPVPEFLVRQRKATVVKQFLELKASVVRAASTR